MGPLVAPLYANKVVFEMRDSLPEYQPGDNVPPVREYGPVMIAPRLANPERALLRSSDAQRLIRRVSWMRTT
eukprot:6239883-Alexandrium_andersonii.AAC.1